MKSITTAVLLVGSVLLLGCQQNGSQSKSLSAGAPQSVAALRAQLQERYPNAHVGQVTAALPDQPYVAVSDVPVQDFKAGDIITFMAPDQTIIANGTVVAIVQNSLHINYTVKPGQRTPRVGDLAISRLQQ